MFLPPGIKEGSIRSVMTQVLFWVELHFTDDPYFWQDLEKSGSHAYMVSRRGGKDKLCFGMDGEILGDTGFILCQSGEHPFNSLASPRNF